MNTLTPDRLKQQGGQPASFVAVDSAPVGTVFARTEKKFVISKDQMKRLVSGFAEHMQADEYGKTTITSLYLDTANYYLMRQSIEKPLYKEKYRIRWYGEAGHQDPVFFEVKKKVKGVVYKRRVPMTYEEAIRYATTGARPFSFAFASREQQWEANQMLNEFDHAFKVNGGLRPAFLVSYDRIAFAGIEDPDLRITFDSNVMGRPGSYGTIQTESGYPIVDSDQVIMEIKCHEAMPLWLTRLLDTLCIYSRSFSKSGTAYKELVAFGNKDWSDGHNA